MGTWVNDGRDLGPCRRRLNRERGLTFVIVTHDIAVGRRADRIVRMLGGRVVGEERLEDRHARAGHAA
ncbi:MAG TPA: hypothetical protein VE623_23495 [Acidimicrobiales bacterium]|jgi:ABC-type glutathione transport system ATPase component|nr:hypothetical protein [Acidimicrobiales bacterium]